MYDTTTDMVSKTDMVCKSQEIPPSLKIEKDLPNVIVEEIKQITSSNNCIQPPKMKIVRETKVSRSRSYHYALRKTIYINFTENGQSSCYILVSRLLSSLLFLYLTFIPINNW